MTLKRLALTFCLSLIPFTAFSQQAPVQNAQAVALATQALAALTGGTQVNDVTLTGTAMRIAGAIEESGNVTLKALGTSDSRSDSIFPSGTYSEIRNSSNGAPQGYWLAPGASFNDTATHNCMTDAVWFFPEFFSAFGALQGIQLTYIGPESLNGELVQHLRVAKILSNSSTVASANTIAFMATLSQTEIYLDSQSLLPVEVKFNQHPDTDAGVDIPVTVALSDYRTVNGIRVPFHIQKYIQNGLNIDLVVTTVTINSGLSTAEFQVQ